MDTLTNQSLGVGIAIIMVAVFVVTLIAGLLFVGFVQMMDNARQMRKILQRWDEEGLPKAKKAPDIPAEKQ